MTARLRRPLPPAGIEYVLLAGRRRRRRGTAVAVAASFALLAAGAGAVRSHGGAVRRIEMVDTPPAPSRTPAADPASPSTVPATRIAVPAGTAAPSVDRELPGRPARATAAPVPSAAPPAVSGQTEEDGGPVMAGPGKTDDTSVCPGATVSVDPWCTVLTGDATVRSGTPSRFTFWICRNGVPTTARYATRQEAEFTVRSGSATRWTWSGGFPFAPRSHSLTFEAGYCYSWSVEWTGADADGRPLPEGTYTMAAYGTADNEPEGTAPPEATLRVRVVR